MGIWSSVKKKLKKVPGLGDLIEAVEAGVDLSLELASQAVTAEYDFSKLIDEGADAINAALEASDEVEAIGKAQAILWVSMAINIITASIADGELGKLLDGKIGSTVASLRSDLQPLITEVQKEQRRIQGIVDSESVQLAVRSVQDANRIALIVSPAYRNQVEKVYQYTREISRSVFGDAATVQAGLSMFQMLTYDLGSLTGEKVDVSNTKYFSGATDITNHIANNAQQYQRNPAGFWYDLNRLWLNPTQQAILAEREKQNGTLSSLSATLKTTSETLEAVDKRFVQYREVADPLLSDSHLAFLDRMKRNFDLEYAQPFKALSTYVNTRFPVVEEDLASLETGLQSHDRRLQGVEFVVADPSTLPPDKAAKQVARINSILNATLTLPPTSDHDRLEAQGKRIEGILSQIGRK
jgi:hypothetical protein